MRGKRGSPCQLDFRGRFWDWRLRMKYIRKSFGKVGNMIYPEREDNRKRDFGLHTKGYKPILFDSL